MNAVVGTGSSEDDLPASTGPDGAGETWWTSERRALVKWLDTHAPALTPLYEGALSLAARDSFPGRVHFITHAIREIQNRLPGALGPMVKRRDAGYEQLTDKIQQRWVEQGLPEDGSLASLKESVPTASGLRYREVSFEFLSSVSRLIEEHAAAKKNRTERERSSFGALGEHGQSPPHVAKNWNKLFSKVHGFAHARGEPLPEGADAEWVEHFFRFEEYLMFVQQHSYENLDELDKLLEKANENDWLAPSDSELDQVAALAIRPENRPYFFDRLENPTWVTALAKRGYFAPPDPVPADEPGYVQFPPWPESRYLVRMVPSAAVEVAKVLNTMPPSANPNVTNVLLECAQALPSQQFKELALKTVEWTTDTEATESLNWFAATAASTICRLVREGKTKQGLKVAKVLLRLERRSGSGEDDETTFPMPPEPIGCLSNRRYKRAVETMLPDLVDSAGIEGLRLFSRLLAVAVKFSTHPDEPPDSGGYSNIWRPAIENHPQNRNHGVRSTLVSAVRDAAVHLAGVSDNDLQETVKLLEEQTMLHRRIALHVLAVVPGGAELAAERVANRDIFDEHRLIHEYSELLRTRLADVSPEARRAFMDWVVDGPDPEIYRRQTKALTGSVPSPDDEVAYSEQWKRDWLSIVAEHLSGDDAEEYRELVAKHGEAGHPDFLSWSESWVGPETPLSVEKMNEMSVGDVIEHLATWEPGDRTDWDFGPTSEGLGRAFKGAVTSRAAEFAAVADRMKPLDPTYTRHFLSGLEAAVKAGTSVPWEPPIRLMAFVLDQPFEAEDGSPDRDRDAGWNWARGEVATLAQEGVADRDNRIPFELREAIWDVLEPLTRDPNPTPVYEETFGYGSMDSHTMSINVNRGKAMHAVMAYALWCRRELESQGIDAAAGFDLMPEVREVLEEHLDPALDPSLAVRAVYGRWLPWLLLLDEQWVTANIVHILPRSPELAALRDAAWTTYVSWCPPFNPVCEALYDEYEAAVERVPSRAVVGFANESTDAKLGEHLVTFYWRGRSGPGLLQRWFEFANDELAARVMDFLGRVLDNTEGGVEPEVLDRIRALWDSRLQVIAQDPESHKSEAESFAFTFASAEFNDDWSLAGLEITLRAGSPRGLGDDVIGRLGNIASTKPAEATRFTLEMLKGTTDDWDHFDWRDQVRNVLAAVSQTKDPETVENRAAIVDHYVKRGQLDFREFAPARNQVVNP